MPATKWLGLWVGRTVWPMLALMAACIPGVDQQPPFSGPSTPPSAGGGFFGPPPVFEPARNADRLPPPISGGTLRVLADGRTAVASDPDRDSIFVVDYRKQALLATVTLSPGDEPGRIEQDSQGRVHVVLRRGGALVTLNPADWSIAGRRAICAAPRGVVYESAQDLLHVACADGALVSLAPAPDGLITRRLQLDRDLRDVVVDGDLLLVSRFLTAQVLTVTRAGAVSERRTPPSRPTFFGRGSSMSAGSAPVDQLMEPGVAWRLLQLAPGQTMLVHQRALNGDVVTQPGGYSGGRCTGIVESAVSMVGPLAPPVASPPIMGSVLPVDIAILPQGTHAVLVSAGNARQPAGTFTAQLGVVELMPVNPMGGDVCTFPSMTLPTGMVSPPSVPVPHKPGDVLSDVISGLNQPLGEAVAVAVDPSTGHVLVQTREPATIQVVTSTDLGARILLSRESRLDTGHGIFHANSGGGVACASCHPEGGDDGRVWRFTEGSSDASGVTRTTAPVEARRTQNLRGGVMATAPFHWNGDLKDITTLMTEVFVKRMGGPNMDAAALGTLNKWLDSVPALPPATTLDGAAVERGRVLFNQTTPGCARCHVGALLTDNKTQDVGTGRSFQVPSLRGVRYRAPYMHDGCAATLADRFKSPCGGGDKHGLTSALTAAQVSDLVAFMETL